jgi:hypothetical protein
LIEVNLKPVMLLPYFIKAWLKQAKVWQQLTNVLAKVWLDESTISSFTKPNFSSGRTSNFELQILTSTKQLNQQRLSADGILIPNLRQYSVVSRDYSNQCKQFFVTKFWYIYKNVKLWDGTPQFPWAIILKPLWIVKFPQEDLQMLAK